MSQIVWTALPKRIKDGNLELSVFVSPRLDVTSLAATPFANWPSTLGALTSLDLIFSSGPVTATVTNAPFNAKLWDQMFANTKVKPFQFTDHSARPIWSFHADAFMQTIDSVYHNAAQSDPNKPPLMDMTQAGQSSLIDTIISIHEANKARVTLKHQLYQNPSDWTQASLSERTQMLDPKLGHNESQPLTTAQQNFYKAMRFFDRPSPRKDWRGYLKTLPVVKVPEFEFHEKIALLSDHPYLLRQLGLVIDLVVPMPRGMLTSGRVAVQAPGGYAATDVTPKTVYLIEGNRFLPAPRPGSAEAAQGMLPLDNGQYAVLQGEVNGDVNKFTDFASNMVNLVASLDKDHKQAKLGNVAPATRQGLPARRTTGFLVTRKDRETSIMQRFLNNKDHNAKIEQSQSPDLYADDVTRGYRVDVLPQGGEWKSLHRRRVAYAFTNNGNTTAINDGYADEGYVKVASGSSDPDPSGPKDLYVHESLFGWEGWSLAAPRPGRVVSEDYTTDMDKLSPQDRTPCPDFQIDARSRVEPGSLHKLRFGQAYSLRARLVDLAGNSLDFDSDDAKLTPHASAPQTYKRYEPIAPPTIVLRSVITEGESLEHMVVRSGEADGKTLLDPDTYAAWLNTAYKDPAFPMKYQASCDRHIAPPKNTQERAEAHGKFDNAFLNGADRQYFFRLATREEGGFADKRIVDLNVDDDGQGAGYLANPNGAMIITPPQVPQHKMRTANGAPNVSSLTEHRGDALAPGEYVICTADHVTVPYLPDVPAAGVAFFDEANADVFALQDTAWTGNWPELNCYRLRLSGGGSYGVDGSQPNEKVIKLEPGTMKKIRFASTPDQTLLSHMQYWVDHSQSPDIVKGRHWMMTPSRELTLVHAVQKPLKVPSAPGVKISRKIDETFVTHEGSIQLDGNSTGHVDMVASWFEYEDRLTRPMPNDIIGDANRPATPQSGHAYQLTVDYGTGGVAIPASQHEFGDTKHRVLTYTPVATTRYKEYFPAALIANPDNITKSGTAPGPLPGGQWSIPSSARPAAPKVLYVVPTFKWDAPAIGGKSTRKGGGLRVYLDRPWYSSGEGEQIAVITAHPTLVSVVTDDVMQLCSRWGRDPIWNSKANGALYAATFTNAKSVVTGLKLAESQTASIDAVVYDVQYNAERKLWYFDIEMDPGQAYFPFVSLMLARYQKESLTGVELSPCVRAEFAQLVPDRTLTVSTTSTSCTVTVKGVVADNYWGANNPFQPPNPPSRVGQAPVVATPLSHKFVAYVQQRTAGSVGEIGWNKITAEVELSGSMPLNTALGQWAGVVNIPAPANPPLERRLVVEEREVYDADTTFAQQGDITYAINTAYRTVYVDTMSLGPTPLQIQIPTEIIK